MNNEQKSEEDNEELNNERIEHIKNIEPTDKEEVEMAKKKKKQYSAVKSHTRKVGKKKIKVRAHLRKNR